MSSPNLESGKARDRMLGAAMYEGRVRVFVSLGGNLALAAPDTPYTFEALQNCELTVHVATKLNRSHIVHGKQALILPCLARSDKDEQAGRQGVSVEDAMSMVHMSRGMKEPECAILARLAQAMLTTVRSHDLMDETDLRDRGLSESGIAGYSTQSGQPVTKHLEVEVTPSRPAGHGQ